MRAATERLVGATVLALERMEARDVEAPDRYGLRDLDAFMVTGKAQQALEAWER